MQYRVTNALIVLLFFFQVKCVARIFDVYERTAVQVADENYPQVRVLSKSDNGVHYSFMSDKDEGKRCFVEEMSGLLWIKFIHFIELLFSHASPSSYYSQFASLGEILADCGPIQRTGERLGFLVRSRW